MIVTDVYPGKDSRHARARDHRVLVVSGFLEASCGEPTDTAGENVTATKHGFGHSPGGCQ
jgi:hypothetical protein